MPKNVVGTMQRLAKFKGECERYFKSKDPSKTMPDPRQFDASVRRFAEQMLEDAKRNHAKS